MKMLCVLMAVLLLTSCGGGLVVLPPQPSPENAVTVTGDGFSVTVAPNKGVFFVGIGQTAVLQVKAQISKPNVVAQVKVFISSDFANLSFTPVEQVLNHNQSLDFSVKVKPEAVSGDKPFFSLFVQALDQGGTPISQVVEVFQWTLP